jgi:predicted deacylase
MRAEAIEINGIKIEPGETNELKIFVGRIPSGARIYIRGQISHAEQKGPTVLITGGVHGDEINSVQIVRRFMKSGVTNNLLRGTVITIPVVNVYGFVYFSRDLPDGKDVNRSFPGSAYGSLASRIANIITKKIMPSVDYGMDFHTGGASRYNYPQIRFSKEDQRSEELARVFGAPHTLSRSTIPKSLRRVALKEKKPFLVFEGGESLRLDGLSIDVAGRGIRRVLHHLEMIEEAPPKYEPTVHMKSTSWIRASQSGLFTWSRSSGDSVHRKDSLGIIQDPHGELEVQVLSSRDGFLVGHNNAAVVSQGDALFHVGYDYEIWEP